MPNTITKGKAGYWWIINAAPNSAVTLYWTGYILTINCPIFSINASDAAQFLSRESAEFQAKFLIGKNNWQAEQHLWR